MSYYCLQICIDSDSIFVEQALVLEQEAITYPAQYKLLYLNLFMASLYVGIAIFQCMIYSSGICLRLGSGCIF